MWRLKIAENGPWLTTTDNHIGRQHWEFDPDAGTPQERAEVERVRLEFTKNRFKQRQSSDLLMRMQLRKENPCGAIPEAVKVKETEEITEEAVTTTLRRGISFYSSIQAHDGHWPSDYSGPLFLLPILVMALYATGAMSTILSPEHKKEMIRYIYNHQNEDGGWGLDIEGPSTLFSSALNYICLRLLGEGQEDGVDMAMARGRKWILDHGGLLMVPSWGKFWVSVIGLYEWSGCYPLPPELWLLPQSLPVHPGKMMCYCRLPYMAMSYLYGKRFVGPITGLIKSLREELYNEPYHQINWNKACNAVSKEELCYPRPLVQQLKWGFLQYFAEPLLTFWPFTKLREKALKVSMRHVHYEDENSRYLCIGLIAKSVCLLACWVEDPDGEAFKRHLARLPDYYWVAEDGLKIPLLGSQLWETTFSIQAISSNLWKEYGPTLRKAHDFVKSSQIQENPSGDFKAMCRYINKGGWAFSIQDHGWQTSDGTAEALKCLLLFSQMPMELVGTNVEVERLYDAVNVILSVQGSKGGFYVWEPQNINWWLEKLNPTEFFGEPPFEKEYLECTGSAIQGLAMFKKLHPNHRRNEIDASIAKAVQYIEHNQNPDGSWDSYWGIWYLYCTWFAVEGLVASGRNYSNSPVLCKACEFLLSKQLPCGGWGESYLSCKNKVYTNIEENRANLVQTSWALLSLINAGQATIDPTPIHRGIRVLINSQMYDGDFPQQEMVGVLMTDCRLNYPTYRNVFPIWALGEYHRQVLCA